jgi:hypothetical protein
MNGYTYSIIVVPTWLVILVCGTVIASSIMSIIREEMKKKRKSSEVPK